MKLLHTDEIPDELYEAARVVDFIEERQSGRWRTTAFTVTEQEYRDKMVHLTFKHQDDPERRAIAKARAVPPGDYLCLQRKMTEEEARMTYKVELGFYPEDAPPYLPGMDQVMPETARWVPIMSDTPAEIAEHAHALNNATGNVLITGLGLGCIAHALLQKPGVKRIDIVEIDPDVIELTGAYFVDPRVHIHRGSAIDPTVLPPDLRWDYAWHDIWSHISTRNLKHETAEHGISYHDLFRLYSARATTQSAWAYREAQFMLEVEEAEEQREREVREAILALPRDEWWKPVYEQVLRDRVVGASISRDEPFPDQLRQMLDPKGLIAADVREQVAQPEFEASLRGSVTDGEEDRPIGNPNDSLEV